MKKKLESLQLKKEVISRIQSKNIVGGGSIIGPSFELKSFDNECRWSQGPIDFENAGYSEHC